jgi:hypothetical protein
LRKRYGLSKKNIQTPNALADLGKILRWGNRSGSLKLVYNVQRVGKDIPSTMEKLTIVGINIV